MRKLFPESRSGRHWLKILVLVLFLGATAFAFFRFSDSLTLENLAKKEEAIRNYQSEHPLLVITAAFAIYVGVTGLSLPGAAVLTLVFGWYFGFWFALPLVSFASTTGATIAFLTSRFLLRDTLRKKFGKRQEDFNAALEKEGPFYLFSLRLIPILPFFLINLVMGLTPMKTWTFWWVSQVGMLAGTVAYVYAGSSVPDLATLAAKGLQGIISPRLLIALVVLGLLPLIVKKTIVRLRPNSLSE